MKWYLKAVKTLIQHNASGILDDNQEFNIQKFEMLDDYDSIMNHSCLPKHKDMGVIVRREVYEKRHDGYHYISHVYFIDCEEHVWIDLILHYGEIGDGSFPDLFWNNN